MKWLTQLLNTDSDNTSQAPQSQAELLEVQKALTSVNPDKVPLVACIALHAARLAGADMEISEGEKQRIAEILQKQTQISPDEARAAAEIASAQELANSIEHYKIAELTNQIATLEQKQDILRALFYVACDEDISEVESEKIRAISKSLLISNERYILIRSEYSEHRSLLKNTNPSK